MKKSIFILMAVVLGLTACNDKEVSIQDTRTNNSSEILSVIQSPDLIMEYPNGYTIEITTSLNDSNECFVNQFDDLGVLTQEMIAISSNGEMSLYLVEDMTLINTFDLIEIGVGSGGDISIQNAGESFSDCFKRNWNDFCSDLISCAAQISSPHAVAIACAIACGIDAASAAAYIPPTFLYFPANNHRIPLQ
jgi:hypothetical protein